MVSLINSILQKAKIQIKRFPNQEQRRLITILNNKHINHVLDVGANIGQYSLQLRAIGYKSKITSFEPINEMFNQLQKNCSKDINWNAINMALGNENTTEQINISKNFASSSILEITSQSTKIEPETAYVSKQQINVRKLDDIFFEYCNENENVFLKIDVQGFEYNVLQGSGNVLQYIKGIQLEMSLSELYKGELLFLDMMHYIKNLGFELQSLEPGFWDHNTGKLLQVDGVFVKK